MIDFLRSYSLSAAEAPSLSVRREWLFPFDEVNRVSTKHGGLRRWKSIIGYGVLDRLGEIALVEGQRRADSNGLMGKQALLNDACLSIHTSFPKGSIVQGETAPLAPSAQHAIGLCHPFIGGFHLVFGYGIAQIYCVPQVRGTVWLNVKRLSRKYID